MLSDEEKKAIDELIARREYFEYNKEGCNYHLSFDEWETEEIIDVILNLIEKQYKEIEELKNITKSYDSFLGDEKIVIADKKFFVNGYFQENFVRKDKIKAKIEEIEKEIKVKREMAKNPMDRVSGRLLTDNIVELEKTKKVLQSVLEKE